MKFLFFDIDSTKISEYQNVLGKIKNLDFLHGSLDDIMKNYNVDVLVSPANSFGVMTGGIDRDIAKKYPMVVQNVNSKVSDSYNSDSGGRKFIPVGTCEAVSLDNKKKVLLIAPTMFLPRNIVGTNNVAMAFIAILNRTKRLKHTERDILVACPCLGTGVGGLGGKESANQILRALVTCNW